MFKDKQVYNNSISGQVWLNINLISDGKGTVFNRFLAQNNLGDLYLLKFECGTNKPVKIEKLLMRRVLQNEYIIDEKSSIIVFFAAVWDTLVIRAYDLETFEEIKK